MEEEKIYQDLLEHGDFLLKNYSEEDLYQLGKTLSYRHRISYDYYLFCKKNEKTFQEYLSVFEHEKILLGKLVSHQEVHYIVSHINEIIRGPYSLTDDILSFLKAHFSELTEDEKKSVELSIIHSISEYYPHVSDYDMERFYHLLHDIAEKEHTSLLDIRKINYGGFSKIYRLGDRIIKVGSSRACEKIVDNRRLLLPDFKGKIGSDYVEITDYLDDVGDASFEEIYEVYEELREQGILWLDANENNLARINQKSLENNRIRRAYVSNLDLLPNPHFNTKELSVGDLVIIDLDHIVYDTDLDQIERIQWDLSEVVSSHNDVLNMTYQKRKK